VYGTVSVTVVMPIGGLLVVRGLLVVVVCGGGAVTTIVLVDRGLGVTQGSWKTDMAS
jgi:hypothetical protein